MYIVVVYDSAAGSTPAEQTSVAFGPYADEAAGEAAIAGLTAYYQSLGETREYLMVPLSPPLNT